MPDHVVDAKAALRARLGRYTAESEQARRPYEHRMAKNLRLIRGILAPELSTASRVRGRSKLFYRKIWSIQWRLLASAYAAFLRDPETFRVRARGPEDVRPRAEILQILLEFRRDQLLQTSNFFLKQLWAFQEMFDTGIAIGKWRWQYTRQHDRPDFVLYPFEQVQLDFLAETDDAQRYVGFEHYLTREHLETQGFSGATLDRLTPIGLPYNQLRAVRYATVNDPLQNPKATEYPASGRYYEGQKKESPVGQLYCVKEWFWREHGVLKFAVLSGDTFLRDDMESPYGPDEFPTVFGSCLTMAHQLIGEGFAESLEGPQESINASINARKDNVALLLNRPTLVGRFANVDLQSLMNRRAGGLTLSDDVNQIKELEMADATRTAYQDAASDELMMQDMSGVIPALEGRSHTDKTGVAQLNLAQGNAKLELYLAIMENTFMTSLYGKLARMIQRFESDETIFRVANQAYEHRTQSQLPFPVLSVDDFTADVVVEVGVGAVSREQQIQQIMFALDRGMQANNAVALMAKAGMIPPDGAFDVVNIPKLFQDLYKKMGRQNVADYIMKWQVGPPPGTDSTGPMGQAAAGGFQAQGQPLATANDLQRGGLGGF